MDKKSILMQNKDGGIITPVTTTDEVIVNNTPLTEILNNVQKNNKFGVYARTDKLMWSGKTNISFVCASRGIAENDKNGLYIDVYSKEFVVPIHTTDGYISAIRDHLIEDRLEEYDVNFARLRVVFPTSYYIIGLCTLYNYNALKIIVFDSASRRLHWYTLDFSTGDIYINNVVLPITIQFTPSSHGTMCTDSFELIEEKTNTISITETGIFLVFAQTILCGFTHRQENSPFVPLDNSVNVGYAVDYLGPVTIRGAIRLKDNIICVIGGDTSIVVGMVGVNFSSYYTMRQVGSSKISGDISKIFTDLGNVSHPNRMRVSPCIDYSRKVMYLSFSYVVNNKPKSHLIPVIDIDNVYIYNDTQIYRKLGTIYITHTHLPKDFSEVHYDSQTETYYLLDSDGYVHYTKKFDNLMDTRKLSRVFFCKIEPMKYRNDTGSNDYENDIVGRKFYVSTITTKRGFTYTTFVYSKTGLVPLIEYAVTGALGMLVDVQDFHTLPSGTKVDILHDPRQNETLLGPNNGNYGDKSIFGVIDIDRYGNEIYLYEVECPFLLQNNEVDVIIGNKEKYGGHEDYDGSISSLEKAVFLEDVYEEYGQFNLYSVNSLQKIVESYNDRRGDRDMTFSGKNIRIEATIDRSNNSKSINFIVDNEITNNLLTHSTILEEQTLTPYKADLGFVYRNVGLNAFSVGWSEEVYDEHYDTHFTRYFHQYRFSFNCDKDGGPSKIEMDSVYEDYSTGVSSYVDMVPAIKTPIVLPEKNRDGVHQIVLDADYTKFYDKTGKLRTLRELL